MTPQNKGLSQKRLRQPPHHTITFDAYHLPIGIYIVRVQVSPLSGSGVTIGTGTPTMKVQKIVLVK